MTIGKKKKKKNGRDVPKTTFDTSQVNDLVMLGIALMWISPPPHPLPPPP